jgi:hypothetical protein
MAAGIFVDYVPVPSFKLNSRKDISLAEFGEKIFNDR